MKATSRTLSALVAATALAFGGAAMAQGTGAGGMGTSGGSTSMGAGGTTAGGASTSTGAGVTTSGTATTAGNTPMTGSSTTGTSGGGTGKVAATGDSADTHAGMSAHEHGSKAKGTKVAKADTKHKIKKAKKDHN